MMQISYESYYWQHDLVRLRAPHRGLADREETHGDE